MDVKQAKSEITTGEFAKLCGVSKHHLLYYDKLGVFGPSRIADNGYRYYSASQTELFQVIMILRDMGTPLQDIKTYMSDRNPDDLIHLLEEKEAKMEEEIAQIRRRQYVIRQKHRDIMSAGQARLNRTVEVTADEMYMIYFDDTDDYKESVQEYTKLILQCEEKGIPIDYSWGGIFSREDMERGDYYKYRKYYMKTDNAYAKKHLKKAGLPILYRPAGRYLTYCDKGYEWNNEKSYHALKEFAVRQGISIADVFYEDMLQDDLAVHGYENYIVKISVEIC